MIYVMLVVGFVLLLNGADFFVDGSSGIAKKFGVPSFIVGLTIVAMGTSAPELAVSVSAAIQGSNEIAVSNVIGSNIFNLIVVCGICALVSPLLIHPRTLKVEFPIAIGAGVLLFFLGADFLSGRKQILGKTDGFILLVLFLIFMVWMVCSAKKNMRENTSKEEYKDISGVKCFASVAGGLVAIIVGGNLVVDSATAIAERFGMSQTLIGLTIVAFGTSLPELVTSVVAAKKGENEMALGNVIGSNIFNILLILGVSSVITPVKVSTESLYDLILLSVMSLFVYLFAFTKKRIGRIEGFIMIAIYAAYIYYIIRR